MAYDVSALSAYVEEHREVIFKRLATALQMTKYCRLLPGVKGAINLNIITGQPTFQSGASCGLSPSGDVAFSQRMLQTAPIAVKESFCPNTLLGYWQEYLVKVDAGLIREDMPFEDQIVRLLMGGIIADMDKALWQGDTVSGTGNMAFFDGWLTTIAGDTDITVQTITSGASAYAAIMSVYGDVTDAMIASGVKIFVDPAIYRAAMQDLVALNLFHFNPGNSNESFILPGTSIEVVNTAGLVGTYAIVATPGENLVYGFDIEDAVRNFRLWYSDDDEVFYLKVLWNAGAQYAFSDTIAAGVMAAAPAPITPASATLASIAAGVDTLADADHIYKTKEQA